MHKELAAVAMRSAAVAMRGAAVAMHGAVVVMCRVVGFFRHSELYCGPLGASVAPAPVIVLEMSAIVLQPAADRC